MKSLLILVMTLMAFTIIPIIADAQTGPPPATTTSPISQPLIREGTLAVELTGDLNLGRTENESEAEELLSAAGIAPRNGWIADYPVTPDIVGELQAAVGEAADSGKVSLGRIAALQALQDAMSSFMMPITPDTSDKLADNISAPSYPDSTVANNYYDSEGPPAVTYYTPPPDYAYMYDWVPCPFWWSNFWFPGFFVLTDFHIRVHEHRHGHEHEGFVTNHFRDPRTGVISRIDPANRFHKGSVVPTTGRTGWTRPATRGGAQAIFDRSRVPTGPAPLKGYRGYGSTPSPEGARSSVFHHSVDRQVEHAASDRGFQSRSSAGQIPAVSHSSEGAPHSAGSGTPGGGGASGGFHGRERR
jgi:hypothetical protein